MELEDFVEQWNAGEFVGFNVEQEYGELIATYHGQATYDSFIKQYVNREPRTRIGVSELGKPAILLGLKAIGYPQETPALKSLFNFHYGDWFESLILNLLKLNGVSIASEQKEIEYYALFGHIDGVVGDNTLGDLVLEVKTMSEYNYSKFSKPVNAHKPWFRMFNEDVHGYATQLGCYSQVLGIDGVWLVLNKSTAELAIVKPDKGILREGYTRAAELAKVLSEVKTLEDVIENFEPPDPEQEWFKKQPTGFFKVPESMRYSEYRHFFYEIVTDLNGYKKETEYVNRIRTPDEMYELLNDYAYQGKFQTV